MTRILFDLGLPSFNTAVIVKSSARKQQYFIFYRPYELGIGYVVIGLLRNSVEQDICCVMKASSKSEKNLKFLLR
jgi:hypothetical protein